MSTLPPALALEGISKRFGAVPALREVSLRIEPGTIHTLLGENGAGKTTLMHVAFGLVSADAGSTYVDGARVEIRSPADAIALGIGMVHQHFSLVPAMTVAENLALGGHGVLRTREMVDAVRHIADLTGFTLDPNARVENLSIGAQQRAEIAKVLARQARILILDEPTAVLAPSEAEDLLRWLRRFADAGHAVVLITHKLSEALAVADRVTVLRHGRVVYDDAAARSSVRGVTAAMLGTDAPSGTEHEHRGGTAGAAVFVARSVTLRDERGTLRLRDASFAVHEREILGVAGVEGAGQHELLRALAGRIEVDEGVIERPSRVGFVPEDRHRDAVLLDRSLTDNVALRDAARRRGRMPWAAIRAKTQHLMREFDVRTPSPDVPLRSLSGGNQQKLVVAREMEIEDRTAPAGAAKPGVALVVENPTRGLDVRATAEVHARLRAARDQGAAIVLYSSDLDEVLALASRIIVLQAGELREMPLDRDVVGRAMLGA